jgi:hypothetical protein
MISLDRFAVARAALVKARDFSRNIRLFSNTLLGDFSIAAPPGVGFELPVLRPF